MGEPIDYETPQPRPPREPLGMPPWLAYLIITMTVLFVIYATFSVQKFIK